MRYAITGSIGTGKTTIANLFKEHGFKVYDADKMVHDLYQDDAVLENIKKMFPEAFKSGSMDNKVIADVIFHNEEKRKELEAYIHPQVKEKILELDNCIIEVPLLFESKMENLFDKVILVYCDKDEQIKRVMNRNNIDYGDALARVNSQMDINEKIKLSDFVIENVGTMENIQKQVNDIINKL